VLDLVLVQWENCRFLDTTLAYTDISSQIFSQIQLCLWFVNWIQQQRFKLSKDILGKAWWADEVVVPLLEKYNWLTNIDVASLFDKVILHEITHTFGAGKSADVCLPTFS